MDFLRAYEFVKHTKNRTYRRVFERGIRRCVRRHHAHDPLAAGSDRQQCTLKLTRIKFGADIMYDRHIASLAQATCLPLRNGRIEIDEDNDPAFTPSSRRRPHTKHYIPCLDNLLFVRGSTSREAMRQKETPSLLEFTQPHYSTPARLKLGEVKVPLLLVHARDDPLVSHDDNYDWASAVHNARIITVRTNRGGHCGWHEGVWPLGPSWAVSMATDYISAVLEQTSQTGWLCAVFDTLQRHLHSPSSPLASRIAHAAASHDHIMPPPPQSQPPYQTMSSLLFDDAVETRSSQANSLVADEREAVVVDDTSAFVADLDDALDDDGLYYEEDDDDDDDDDHLVF